MKTLSQTFLVLLFLIGIKASAQQLNYQPVNPNFGGNYLNYSWLLASANSQNPFDNQESGLGGQAGVLSSFSDSMKRQILNQLTRDLFSGGEGEVPEDGSIEVGGLIITVEDIRNGSIITIIDSETGESTEIIL
ncbi:MAG TPA: curli assembly protein CsgF [Moheibacter sp.]|nr:curli assembly protein CsgF [Moheibacter sp.]